MKTFILATAIALMMSLNLAASTDGTKSNSSTRVQIFQTNLESVDVYVSKNTGDLVKIKIYTESGTPLMTTRVKKQSTRYIRFHLSELPQGTYLVSVEKDNTVLSSMKVSK
ncbi:MAG: T9SS type A sorting domain-containing protein [Bacteroidota bacterium]